MPRAPFHLDAIKVALAANGEMRQTELAKATDLTVGTLHAAVKPGLRSGELLDRREGRAVFYRLADGVVVDPAEADDDEDFRAVLDTDGDLDLYGLVELENGGHRIHADGVRLLCRLLHGQGPEE